MLANDSTTADQKSAMLLIVHVDQVVAELIATCPKCCAMTNYSLELGVASAP
jgi:hypothetical protein